MSKLFIWVATMRPPTLFLSISGILVGSSLSHKSDHFSWVVFILIIMTAICLQILANFSNDYGDYVKGIDNQNRKGPKRALQKGLLTLKEIKVANRILMILIGFFSLSFLFLSFGIQYPSYAILIGLLLILAIIAALRYTSGKYAYGYRGFGDLSVFLFFGGLSVLGTQFILSHELSTTGFLWAVIIGGCCVLVLNINNIRDIENDRLQNKKTLAVILGLKGALWYHYLVTLIIVVTIIYLEMVYLNHGNIFQIIADRFLDMLFILHAIALYHANKQNKMNHMLKYMSLLTFLIGLRTFLISFLIDF
ncbi:MAG: 1,4-dihydroxy-2-naphthoate octaprenyltransferase [Flavobacteriaceae bacterium]|nr:1,4-dihydroxy-2-naphthoate octaprenyltransferase [Flavobacteriaceae bacterium]MCY4297719.1 1,4-dihydroxy-2-naphthoate octaprenyltransferase [Flavobacteriaceae bacterium]